MSEKENLTDIAEKWFKDFHIEDIGPTNNQKTELVYKMRRRPVNGLLLEYSAAELAIPDALSSLRKYFRKSQNLRVLTPH